MKTPIEVHNGIPLGVPREWSKSKWGDWRIQLKHISHKGKIVAEIMLFDDDSMCILMGCNRHAPPNQTAALEWIAGQIKENEDA